VLKGCWHQTTSAHFTIGRENLIEFSRRESFKTYFNKHCSLSEVNSICMPFHKLAALPSSGRSRDNIKVIKPTVIGPLDQVCMLARCSGRGGKGFVLIFGDRIKLGLSAA
jgi:hypothetical protein